MIFVPIIPIIPLNFFHRRFVIVTVHPHGQWDGISKIGRQENLSVSILPTIIHNSQQISNGGRYDQAMWYLSIPGDVVRCIFDCDIRAGERSGKGEFEPGTVHYLADQKLRQWNPVKAEKRSINGNGTARKKVRRRRR